MVKFRKGFAKFSIRIALSEKFLGEQFIMSIESVKLYKIIASMYNTVLRLVISIYL